MLVILRIVAALLRLGSVSGLLGAAASDLAERRIPNRLVLIILAGGAAIRLLTDPQRIWISVLGGAGIFLVLGLISYGGFIGGGDVKLITATTLLVPPDRVFPLLLHIAIAGGVLGGIYLAARNALRTRAGTSAPAPVRTIAGSGMRRWLHDERSRIAAGEPMPYGVAICAGATYCLLVEVL